MLRKRDKERTSFRLDEVGHDQPEAMKLRSLEPQSLQQLIDAALANGVRIDIGVNLSSVVV